MAPWDMLPYFQIPQVFLPSSGGTPGQPQDFVPGDPMRVLLVFVNNSASGVSLGPGGVFANGQYGFFVPQQSAPLVINQAWYGALTALPWQILFTGGTGVLAYGVSMYKWPKGGGNQPDVSQIIKASELLRSGNVVGAVDRPQSEAVRSGDMLPGTIPGNTEL